LGKHLGGRVTNDVWRSHATIVCGLIKPQAGVFSTVGNDVQCGEFTNLDVYSAKVRADFNVIPLSFFLIVGLVVSPG
jgi:hypothetical protein